MGVGLWYLEKKEGEIITGQIVCQVILFHIYVCGVEVAIDVGLNEHQAPREVHDARMFAGSGAEAVAAAE